MASVVVPVVIVLGCFALCLLVLGLLVDSILKRLEENYDATEE